METIKAQVMANEMIILKDEKFGSPISEKLADLLKSATSKEDRIKAHEITGVGLITINNVLYRLNNLTKGNSQAIVELVKIAIEGAGESLGELNAILKQQ